MLKVILLMSGAMGAVVHGVCVSMAGVVVAGVVATVGVAMGMANRSRVDFQDRAL